MTLDQDGSRLIEIVEDTFLTEPVTLLMRGYNLLSLPNVICACEVWEKEIGCDPHLFPFNITIQCKLIDYMSLIPDYR